MQIHSGKCCGIGKQDPHLHPVLHLHPIERPGFQIDDALQFRIVETDKWIDERHAAIGIQRDDPVLIQIDIAAPADALRRQCLDLLRAAFFLLNKTAAIALHPAEHGALSISDRRARRLVGYEQVQNAEPRIPGWRERPADRDATINRFSLRSGGGIRHRAGSRAKEKGN